MQEVLNEYHSEKVIRAAGIGKDRAVVEKDVAVNRMEVSSNPALLCSSYETYDNSPDQRVEGQVVYPYSWT